MCKIVQSKNLYGDEQKAHPLFQTIHTFITQHKLIEENQTIIIGLSGGPDSVFLTHFLVHLKPFYNLTLIAAHLDHGWRAESADDVLFCKNLSEKLGISFVSQQLASLPLILKYNGSKEEIGRKARRFFFEQTAAHYNAHAIALGHHAQDQQETFFIRLVRGASLTGLAGMKPQEKQYIRPLLTSNKQAIVEYLKQENILFIVDESNNQGIYLRNRIRKSVLPALQTCDARFDANFMNTLQRIQETEHFLQELTLQAWTSLAHSINKKWIIDCAALLALHSTLRYRVILYWLCQEHVPFPPSQDFLNEIIRFLDSSDSKNHALHVSWQLVKKRNHAWIDYRAQSNSPTEKKE